jgi:hypothetical protein
MSNDMFYEFYSVCQCIMLLLSYLEVPVFVLPGKVCSLSL